jgi:hypothetical protein
VYLRLYSTAQEKCLPVLELRIRGCGEKSTELLKKVEWPEVSKAVMEGECVELIVPSEPPPRIANALRKLGLERAKVLAYREVAETNITPH